MLEGVAGTGEARGTGGGCSGLRRTWRQQSHTRLQAAAPPLTQPILPGPHGFPSLPLFVQTGTFYSCFVTL